MKTSVTEPLLAVAGFTLSDLVMNALTGQQPVLLGREMQPCEDTLTLTLAHRIPIRHAEDPSGAHARPSDSPVTVATARRLARHCTPGGGAKNGLGFGASKRASGHPRRPHSREAE